MKGISASELMFRKLRGVISPEEEAALEQSLLQNPEDRQTFEELSRIWNETSPPTPEFYPDVDTAWQKVMLKIEKPPQETKEVRIDAWKIYSRYAAAAVLVISVLFASWLIWFSEPAFVTVASGPEIKEVLLPDGSKVWLNRDSKLIYPESFRGNKREVIFSGEGYFEVRKDPEKAFHITGNASVIKVLGTSFSFRSIPGREDDEVSVLSGKVSFSRRDLENPVILIAGSKASLSGTMITRQQVEDPNLLAWKSRKLVFSNAGLKTVAAQLEKFFGKKITVSDSLENCRFTGTFEEPQLSQILEIISVTTDAEIMKSGAEIYLAGNGCPDP